MSELRWGNAGDALVSLSPELLAVVQATILDGLTTREAATLLRIPEGTVKSRLMRAKRLMREHLAVREHWHGVALG